MVSTQSLGPLTVVGGGRMGLALAAGSLAAGGSDRGVVIVEHSTARRAELAGECPEAKLLAAVSELSAPEADSVVLAVKPPDIAATCVELVALGPRRVLSVAAGIRLATLEAALGTAAVVRAMPNTPALVGAGASAVAPGNSAGDDDLEWAEGVLGALGRVVRVSETDIDAVTGLSGSGPAYLFLVAEAMVEGGVLAGLTRDTATALVAQTLLGAGKMLVETSQEAASLRAAVTSPGGTTAAGLRALERAAVRSAFIEAVMAATERSRELGGS